MVGMIQNRREQPPEQCFEVMCSDPSGYIKGDVCDPGTGLAWGSRGQLLVWSSAYWDVDRLPV